MAVEAQGSHLRHEGGRVACQRTPHHRRDGLLAPGLLSGRELRRQRLRDLEIPPLHEGGHVAQPELAVPAGRAETVDLACVSPALHRRFADSQEVRDLPGGQDVGLHGGFAPVYQGAHDDRLRAFRAVRCGNEDPGSESQTLLMSVRSQGCIA